MKDIYLAGGPFYVLQEIFSRFEGVTDTVAGYANSVVSEPDIAQIVSGEAGVVECVKVTYDPKKIDISTILKLFFKIVDPHTDGVQGKCVGTQYRSGIYYTSGEDIPQIEYYMRFIQTRGAEPAAVSDNLVVNDSYSPERLTRPVLTEYKKLKNFYKAGSDMQHYLRSHPDAYSPVDIEALAEDGIIKRKKEG